MYEFPDRKVIHTRVLIKSEVLLCYPEEWDKKAEEGNGEYGFLKLNYVNTRNEFFQVMPSFYHNKMFICSPVKILIRSDLIGKVCDIELRKKQGSKEFYIVKKSESNKPLNVMWWFSSDISPNRDFFENITKRSEIDKKSLYFFQVSDYNKSKNMLSSVYQSDSMGEKIHREESIIVTPVGSNLTVTDVQKNLKYKVVINENSIISEELHQ